MKLPDELFGAGSFLVEHAWNLYARVYDVAHPRMVELFGAFGEFSYDEFEEEFINLAELKPGSKVLDIACGTGAALAGLSQAVGDNGKIVGMDLSPKMLERAEQRATELEIENVSFRQGDVEKLSLEFDEESFDAVVSCNGLPNFLRPQRAIVEMCHVLREGGRLALSTINRDLCEEKPLFFLMMRIPKDRFPYKQEFCEMLENLGFVRIKLRERGMMLIIIGDKGSSKGITSTSAPSSRSGRGPRRISPDDF